MVYQNKFVAAVKANNQILRETNDGSVAIPFGSEYAIYLKNLNSVRVMVKVSVDGIDATDGTRLIIAPNSSMELERFIRQGNLHEGNRFKFIERTGEIESHRGAKIDDGVVRIEYWTERPYIAPITWTTTGCWSGASGSNYNYQTTSTCKASASLTSGGMRSLAPRAAMVNYSTPGITVPGSVSQQQFHATNGFDCLPNTDVLILRLVGRIGRRSVAAPITVKSKSTCQTCGHKAKSPVAFCAKCGTSVDALV